MFRRLWSKLTGVPSSDDRRESTSSGFPRVTNVLVIQFGDSPDLGRQFDEDVAVLREFVTDLVPLRPSSVQELISAISHVKPGIVHLLATLDEHGHLTDSFGEMIGLRDLMIHSEECGTRLFVIAAENDFQRMQDQIHQSKVMDFLTITRRNRHFPTFLQGLMSGMSRGQSFALAYITLAPQHISPQRGLPLPGSIAVCPAKKRKGIVLWTEPQP